MVMATVALEQYALPTINYDRSYHTILKAKQQYADHAPANNAVITPKQLIGEALRRRVESIDTESCGAGEEDTFFVADLGEVYRQHMRWKLNLPRVKPFYAVKCNPDPRVIELLAALGTGFDCASKWEIDQILNMGLAPERIIYAQPCKTNSLQSSTLAPSSSSAS
ncbi:ornithine decarboxylase [Verticillium alfalfae VaMs.102]|uniref:ornithine decarboxylase n=1 Tax=Verticillium alfalfae (strain VaMs.102 / ATCC MYA-4576 / FGSC 10136) TaxID=526221 RepID=C9SFE5_VERA1|nr:ornithine decarboxylase [Verticillium alfalfae VaMs.102]EEY17931.1 ornithine decarboxylase [Verticillium alfalfae VaMs.102]